MDAREGHPLVEEVDAIADTIILNQQKTNLTDRAVQALVGQGFTIQEGQFESHVPSDKADSFRDPSVHYAAIVEDLGGTKVRFDVSRLDDLKGGTEEGTYLDFVRKRQEYNPSLLDAADRRAVRVEFQDGVAALISRVPEYSALNPQEGKYNEVCMRITVEPRRSQAFPEAQTRDAVLGLLSDAMSFSPGPWDAVMAGHTQTIETFKQSLQPKPPEI